MTNKPHTALVVTAALLAFAAEGWTSSVGETLAHSVGIPRSLAGIIGAAVLGYLFSVFYDPPKGPPPRKPKR